MRPLFPDYARGPSVITVVESQWENLVLITMDLASPQAETVIQLPFLWAPGK